MEHVRMRIAHEPLNSELVDMELIELKFIFDRRTFLRYSRPQSNNVSHGIVSLVHHDNRDFTILPNYQPRGVASFNQQTQYLEKEPGVSVPRQARSKCVTDMSVVQFGWLWVFLKIYIKAFQLASDLDDSVEDKLLIGDRPKPSHDPETQLPLKERLASRKHEEISEVCRLDHES